MQALGLPRLGNGSKALFIALLAFGLSAAFATNIQGSLILDHLAATDAVLHGEVWRLFTAILVCTPDHLSHLLFSLVGIYFFAPDIEARWGTRRFLTYFFGVSSASYLIAILINHFVPGLRHHAMIGPEAGISALLIAWGNANATAQVRLFFVLPIAGRSIAWITVLLAVLAQLYPDSVPEGALTILAGALLGVAFGAGSREPSLLRRTYLEWKLKSLQRKKSVSAAEQLRLPTRSSKSRAPLLRVVKGGETKPPPKDKRWLN